MARIDEFLISLVKAGGSDLHISAGSPPVVRVHGTMECVSLHVLNADRTAEILNEIMDDDLRCKFASTNDVDFAYSLEGMGRFRVNLFRDRVGVGGVFRQVPTRAPTLAQLNLPRVLRTLADLPKGLVLVTGPTGSGKSTTLAATIDHINNTREGHIITIEDPIEFIHMNKQCLINQREVGAHTASFSSALRAALREDPDIILVGEMRDLETTKMALEAAETGHLVFSTLHTSSAATTVDRIIDQFPEGSQRQIRTMLAASLQGVVSQCLLKRKDGEGRVGALEVLVNTTAVAANIRDGKTHQITSALQTGARVGMIQLNDAIVRLVVRGIVDPVEGYRKTCDKEGLLKSYHVAGVRVPASLLNSDDLDDAGVKTPHRSGSRKKSVLQGKM